MDEAATDQPDDTVSYKELLQSLSSAVALVETGTWRILFENAKFFRWFPLEGDEADLLPARLPDFAADRAAERLGNGRVFKFETKTEAEGRQRALRFELRPFTGMAEDCFLVECLDVSKEAEVQYMLDSYSRMAEKNARELEKEKERVEKLLLNVMPRAVFEEMKQYGTATPQRFEAASS